MGPGLGRAGLAGRTPLPIAPSGERPRQCSRQGPRGLPEAVWHTQAARPPHRRATPPGAHGHGSGTALQVQGVLSVQRLELPLQLGVLRLRLAQLASAGRQQLGAGAALNHTPRGGPLLAVGRHLLDLNVGRAGPHHGLCRYLLPSRPGLF